MVTLTPLQQKLTDANAQLRKGITRLREAAHARNQQTAGHERTVAALKKQLGEKDSKIQQFEEFKRKAQISLRTFTRERDQARAAKGELEEKLKAQSETLEVVTAVRLFSLCFFGRNILTLATVRVQERDKYKAEMQNYQTEAEKYKAEVERYQVEAKEHEAEAAQYKAALSKAKQSVKDLGWVAQVSARHRLAIYRILMLDPV